MADAPSSGRKPLALSAAAFEFKPTATEFVPGAVAAVTEAMAAAQIAAPGAAAPPAAWDDAAAAAPSHGAVAPADATAAGAGAGEDDGDGGEDADMELEGGEAGEAAAEAGEDEDGGAGGISGIARRRVAPAEGDTREHLNVIFIGHVDAGKSTLSGSILYLTGQVDARAIEKFEREAKAKNRESWFLAFIMDTTDEERSKGITVEVGRATFETAARRYTILDAPGHKNYVPNMIAGAAQADVGVLVISARKGEFETGFERGGQTREHAMLAKTLGVRSLVVAVNKMDEPTVKWSKARYDDIVSKLGPFLKGSGYSAKAVTFVPMAGLSGANVKDRAGKDVCPWYDGPSLLEILDAVPSGGRDANGPLRIPVLDRYNDRGVIVMGKIESGTAREGARVKLLPLGVDAVLDTIYINDAEVKAARPGENVKLKVKGCREEDVQRGFVIADAADAPVPVRSFEAQLMLLELEAHSLFTAGYTAVLHVHTAQEEVVVERLVAELDKKGEPKPGPAPKFIKSGGTCVAVLKTTQAVMIEKYDVMQQMGRFTLRDGQRTIAIGKVLRLGIPKSKAAAFKASSSAGGAGGAAAPAAGAGGA